MAIPLSGTYEYTAVVPDHAEGESFTAQCHSRAASDGQHRLVGLNPKVRFESVGLTPDASPDRPFVMRTRITLESRLDEGARVSRASFHVDESLIGRLKAGDVMHFARTVFGGLAMSVLRRDDLVYAVGAVTAVPLGAEVDVRTPLDLTAEATAVFHRRDPEFAFRELPIQIRVGDMTSILFGGRREMGEYRFFVRRGHLIGLPGVDECMSAIRTGCCAEEAASASAMLLALPDALVLT